MGVDCGRCVDVQRCADVQGYPDFIFAALRDDAGERIVAVESKGDQLAGNLDTEYKRELLDTLTTAFGKKVAGDAKALSLPQRSIDFEAAVVLFSDWKARLPVMIKGTAN